MAEAQSDRVSFILLYPEKLHLVTFMKYAKHSHYQTVIGQK